MPLRDKSKSLSPTTKTSSWSPLWSGRLIPETACVGSSQACGVGTEGTISGVGEALKARKPSVKIAGRKANADKLVVVVLPDTGERYLSTVDYAGDYVYDKVGLMLKH